MADEEKIYTIPLRKVINTPRTRRAPVAIKAIKTYISRHMKTPQESVWIDSALNEKIWERGIEKPPSKIRVRALKLEEGDFVEVSLPEE